MGERGGTLDQRAEIKPFYVKRSGLFWRVVKSRFRFGLPVRRRGKKPFANYWTGYEKKRVYT